jgi:hypothetical protein
MVSVSSSGLELFGTKDVAPAARMLEAIWGSAWTERPITWISGHSTLICRVASMPSILG